MYIYNRISQFQGLSPIVTSLVKRKSGSSYKIKKRKPSGNIKTTSVGGSRPSASSSRSKLKPLTKKNSEFLIQLGYKVIRKK